MATAKRRLTLDETALRSFEQASKRVPRREKLS